MKVRKEHILFRKITKMFEVELNNGSIVCLAKTVKDDFDGYDSDWDFDDKDSKDVFDKLTEEDKEDFNDFAEELEM